MNSLLSFNFMNYDDNYSKHLSFEFEVNEKMRHQMNKEN